MQPSGPSMCVYESFWDGESQRTPTHPGLLDLRKTRQGTRTQIFVRCESRLALSAPIHAPEIAACGRKHDAACAPLNTHRIESVEEEPFLRNCLVNVSQHPRFKYLGVSPNRLIDVPSVARKKDALNRSVLWSMVCVVLLKEIMAKHRGQQVTNQCEQWREP